MDQQTSSPLSPQDLERYARHLTLPEIGVEGQARLRSAGVLVIGAGGLGSPALQYLAAAGVGRLGIVDADRVELSNLQRQVLYSTPEVGQSKARRAAERLLALNPALAVTAHECTFNAQNARELAADYDVILDGTDNFPTRYLSNDIAVLSAKPNIYGSIQGFEGQVAVFAPHLGGACYRCMFPTPPPPGLVPTCAEAGVLGVLPGIIGTLQALEALKLILGIGQPLLNRLLIFDALRLRFREIALKRDPECPVCGENPRIRAVQEVDYPAFCGLETPRDADQISVGELREWLAERPGEFQLIDVREDHERAISEIEGATALPLGMVRDKAPSLLNPAQPVVLFCGMGPRSEKAMGILRELGFMDVRSLSGGIRAWNDGQAGS